jgi:hypothetical protein
MEPGRPRFEATYCWRLIMRHETRGGSPTAAAPRPWHCGGSLIGPRPPQLPHPPPRHLRRDSFIPSRIAEQAHGGQRLALHLRGLEHRQQLGGDPLDLGCPALLQKEHRQLQRDQARTAFERVRKEFLAWAIHTPFSTIALHLDLGEEQLYGSQVAYDEYGEPYLLPVENPERLAERRAALRMEPITDYVHALGGTEFHISHACSRRSTGIAREPKK